MPQHKLKRMVPRGGESACGGGDAVVVLPCLEELNTVECPQLKSIPHESCFIKTCKIGDQDMWGIGPFIWRISCLNTF